MTKHIFTACLLAIALVIPSQQASAQEQQKKKTTKIGVTTGLNYGKIKTPGELHSKSGYMIGLTLDHQLTKSWYLTTALKYNTQGGRINNYYTTFGDLNNEFPENTAVSRKIKSKYIQMPIHLGYKIYCFRFTAGPYFAYGIGGRVNHKQEYAETTNNFRENLFTKNGADKFDAGLGFTIGIDFDGFTLSYGYDYGLANIGGNYREEMKNRNKFFALGFKL